MSNFPRMRQTAVEIVNVVEQKDKDYGSSWKKRGGVGAFMMMARKWDRIEQFATKGGYDIFAVLGRNDGDVLDDVKDLIGYLHLIMDELAPEKVTPGLFPEISVALPNDEPLGLRILRPQPPLHPSSRGFMPPDEQNTQFQNEGYYGDGNIRFKCRYCRGETTAKTLAEAALSHKCPELDDPS